MENMILSAPISVMAWINVGVEKCPEVVMCKLCVK
jgi:hypothetical protein